MLRVVHENQLYGEVQQNVVESFLSKTRTIFLINISQNFQKCNLNTCEKLILDSMSKKIRNTEKKRIFP